MNNTNSIMQKLRQPTVIVGILLLIAIIILGVLYTKKSGEMNVFVEEMEREKEMLTTELENLSLDYIPLKSQSDTLNKMLDMEREKITQLIEEIQTIKATNAAKIREYKKELTSLRSVLKSYIVQIDSINQTNKALEAENQQYKKQVTNMQSNFTKLEEVKQDLEEKVEIASKLETFNLEAAGLNSKSRETSRTSRVSKIKVCFTIQKNITAEVGEKNIFMRITRPDGALLYHNKDHLFKYENKEINYSAMRTIEYGGEELDVCLYYDVDSGELTKGEYEANIFADGNNIGVMTFELK